MPVSKCITRQHGCGFVECFVRCRPAAAQIVVVHAGEVVMHERIGVHGFDGCSGARGQFRLYAEQARTLQHQKWPKPLAACENRVARGFVDAGMQTARLRQTASRIASVDLGGT